MDADTTMTKGAHHRILKAFEEKKYKLLVGTQMVAKGLDFENVVLVGLIAPDMTLNMPEFKSAERVFRLISQASGRAGRGKHPGKVILQSYQPEHYAVQAAVANDYEAFYSADLQMRKMGYYPPFSRILRLLFSAADEAAAQQEAQTAAELLKERLHAFEDSTHILLSPAPIERKMCIRDRLITLSCKKFLILKFSLFLLFISAAAVLVFLSAATGTKVISSRFACRSHGHGLRLFRASLEGCLGRYS